jgi:hypothetical protein
MSRPSRRELDPIETAPALIATTGIGTDSASALLVAAGDNPQRLRSEATFAHLCGASRAPNERR